MDAWPGESKLGEYVENVETWSCYWTAKRDEPLSKAHSCHGVVTQSFREYFLIRPQENPLIGQPFAQEWGFWLCLKPVIHHQEITEELLLVLLRKSGFLLQVAGFPFHRLNSLRYLGVSSQIVKVKEAGKSPPPITEDRPSHTHHHIIISLLFPNLLQIPMEIIRPRRKIGLTFLCVLGAWFVSPQYLLFSVGPKRERMLMVSMHNFGRPFKTDSSHADEPQAEEDGLAKIKSPYFITNALKFLPEQMIGFGASYWKLTGVRSHKNQSKSGQRPMK